MQAIAETLFDAVYLISVVTIGILMIRGSGQAQQFRLFGWMAVVLGAGDSLDVYKRQNKHSAWSLKSCSSAAWRVIASSKRRRG